MPLADLEARPIDRLIVKLDPHPRLEGSVLTREPASDPHEPVEELAVDDLGEFDATACPHVRSIREGLCPLNGAAGAQVDLDLIAR